MGYVDVVQHIIPLPIIFFISKYFDFLISDTFLCNQSSI